MTKAMAAAALLASIACGGDDPTVSMSGIIANERMVAQDAISNIVNVDKAGTRKAALIYIADVPSTCAMVTAGQEKKGAKGIGLQLYTATASSMSPPAATGNYPVHSRTVGNGAEVHYWANDTACEEATELNGQSGTVTLTGVGSDGYSGTFDVTFLDGSHVTGSFNTSTCAALLPDFYIGICM